MADSLVLILALTMAGLACGWAGLPLILQKDSMVGDGISHAILPGIVLAFWVTQSREPLPMLVGALLAAGAMVLLMQLMTRVRIVPRDAALGATFTLLFAIGVIGLNQVARQVDLDPGCVIYGLAEMIPLDTVLLGGVYVPRAFFILCPAAVLAGLAVWFGRREIMLGLLDPAHAQLLGRNPRRLKLAILIGVSCVVVACFEAVGSILVVALLVGPGLAALSLTHRFEKALAGIAVASLLNAVLGVTLAQVTNTSVAGMVAVSAGVLVVASILVRQLLEKRNQALASSSR